MSKLEDEVKALRAEVEKLTPTPMPTEAEVAAAKDAAHQMREARASAFNWASREQLAAMQAACPDAQAIVRDHRCAPTGPSQAGASGQVGKVSSNVGLPGSNTGWQSPIPVRPPPGINYVDAQLDAQDARDKAERVQQHNAMQRALGRK